MASSKKLVQPTSIQAITFGSTFVFNTNGDKFPSAKVTGINAAFSFTITNLIDATQGDITWIKSDGTNRIVTFDAAYTHFIKTTVSNALVKTTFTTYTLINASGVPKTAYFRYDLTANEIEWQFDEPFTGGLSGTLATDNILVGVASAATAVPLNTNQIYNNTTTNKVELAVTPDVSVTRNLEMTTAGAIVLGSTERAFYVTDSTQITALTTGTSWTSSGKTVSGIKQGDRYVGTGDDGIDYEYFCPVDGTAMRLVRGSGTQISTLGLIVAHTEVTGTTQAMAIATRYIANNASQVICTLPSVAAVGDSVGVDGKGAGGWKIAQNASQIIHAASDTTTGTGGSIASQARYDCVLLRCITANTDWVIEYQKGTLTTV